MRRYTVTAHFDDGHATVFRFLYLKTALDFCRYLFLEQKHVKYTTMTSTVDQ